MTSVEGMHVTSREEVMTWLFLLKQGKLNKAGLQSKLTYLQRHASGEYLVMLQAALFVVNCL